MDIAKLKASNAVRWHNMKVVPTFLQPLHKVAERLVVPSAKEKYQEVSTTTAVPWFIIAVIHEREASQSWLANLAQGDPWNRMSIHVPRGRGPFASWADAAVDALKHCPPYAAGWKDWSPGGALTLLEEYNGLGYAARGIPSPYVWASTDQYVSGKYIADGHFDPHAVDHQLGCAALLSVMGTIDPSVKLGATS